MGALDCPRSTENAASLRVCSSSVGLHEPSSSPAVDAYAFIVDCEQLSIDTSPEAFRRTIALPRDFAEAWHAGIQRQAEATRIAALVIHELLLFHSRARNAITDVHEAKHWSSFANGDAGREHIAQEEKACVWFRRPAFSLRPWIPSKWALGVDAQEGTELLVLAIMALLLSGGNFPHSFPSWLFLRAAENSLVSQVTLHGLPIPTARFTARLRRSRTKTSRVPYLRVLHTCVVLT